MRCVYFYKGTNIGNEILMTDFLLSKHKLYSKLGDIVFDVNPIKVKNEEKIEEIIRPKYTEIKQRLADFTSRRVYSEDGEEIKYKKPAIGVNRYLGSYVREDGHQIMKEFREDEYWKNVVKQWKPITDASGRITLSGFMDPDIRKLLEESGIGEINLNQVYSDSVYKDWKERIIKKWKFQAELGSAIHAVSELLFTKEKDTYLFDVIEGDLEALVKLYNEKYLTMTDDRGNIISDALDKDPDIRFKLFQEAVNMVQQLRKELQVKYGKDCSFFPELGITADVTRDFDGCNTLMGIIDLLVIDEHGNPHIYDYKTSTKNYENFHETKKTAFTYLLAVYDRMLQTYGINTFYGTTQIVPIKLNDIKLNENGEYTYSGISYEIVGTTYNEVTGNKRRVEVLDITKQTRDAEVIQDINHFMPVNEITSATSENLLENVSKRMQRWFPNHVSYKQLTDEEVNQMLESEGCYKPNKQNMYSWKPSLAGKAIELDATEEDAQIKFFKKVRKHIDDLANQKENIASGFISAWQNAVETGEPFLYVNAREKGGDSAFIQNFMARYCTGDYTLVDIPEISAFGMFILKNNNTKALHVFKMTGDRLERTVDFGQKRTNLNGAFVTNVQEDSKTNSRILKATKGNIEAMEVMHVLNCLDFNENEVVIGEVNVINPYYQQRLPISNRELLYNFKNLESHEQRKYGDLFTNKFKEGNYHLADPVQMLQLRFDEIMQTDPAELHKFKIYLDRGDLNWHSFKGREETYQELNKIRIALESDPAYAPTIRYLALNNNRKSADMNNPVAALYTEVMEALLYVKGRDIRQTLKDSDNWFETIRGVLTEGHEGLNIENPGNFRNTVLNNITESAKNVYLKVADLLNQRNLKLRELVDNLKKELNFGWMQNTITGNQTNLYLDMFREVDGDLWFERPENMKSKAAREFLEFALDTINKNRHANNLANLEDWRNNDDERYFRVPLMAATKASENAVNRQGSDSMLNNLKDRMSLFLPKNIKAGIENFLLDKNEILDLTHDLYEVANRFQSSETDEETRKHLIAGLGGISGVEHNIESLVLAHSFQYLQQEMMEQEMPLIKASAIALANQGSDMNPTTGNYHNLITYIERFVTNKINGEKIDNERLAEMQKPIGKLRAAASYLAMAFNPVQFTYQRVEGIWKDIALMIKKPDGTNAFSRKNMIASFTSVEKNLFHYSEDPTVDELINRAYRINDMDSRQFAERISSDKGWMTHMNDLAFRFASRADFYNRMVIFESQMREHGCWDAHIKDGNRLIYKMELDERYAAYAAAKKAGKSVSSFNEVERESYSRYLSAAQQFVLEGVVNEDGTLFEIGQDLPRAYSNKEATAMKAIADNLYGYYNHEDKSMFNSMFLGGIYMQMKTYLSAKKNQYFAPGGVKQMGKYVDYKEDGIQMYYAKNEDGTIDLEAGFVSETDPKCSGVKVQLWQGQWQEGIIVTIANLITGSMHREDGQSLYNYWLSQWNNPDENLRIAFRSNIKHLLIDIVITTVLGSLIGGWLKDWDDEQLKAFNKDKGAIDKAMTATASHLIYKTFKNSTLDSNPADSIFSGIVDWQPFSFSMWERVIKNCWSVITGDKTIISAAGGSIAVVGNTKPLWVNLTYNE